jgi:hypothetical protein
VVEILTPLFATHTGILTSASSSSPFDLPSTYSGTLPYQTYGIVSVTVVDQGSKSPPQQAGTTTPTPLAQATEDHTSP